MVWRPEPKPFYGGWGEPKYRFEYDVAERLARMSSADMLNHGKVSASIAITKPLKQRWDCLWHHTSEKKAKETFAFELAYRLELGGRARPHVIGLAVLNDAMHACAVAKIDNRNLYRAAMELFESAMGGSADWVITGY